MAIHGHTTNEMDRRYNRIDNEDLIQAVDQLEAYISKVGSVDQTVDQPVNSLPI